MWESIAKILTSENSVKTLIFLAVMILVILFEVRRGNLSFHGKGLKIGTDEKERNIIRQQIEWVHIFIMSLEGKIITDTERYNGYFTKYILERIYDEIVDWITFNHLNNSSAYIEIKQEKICSLVYSMGVKKEFRTKEFKQRMNNWTREVIERLIQIREVYKST